MPQAPGTRLGPYEVLALLGAGGMGEVYRARDQRLERDVAIKVLPQGRLTDDAARSRFRREALALARLSHPNIAAVYDVGEQNGTDYLVMEYIAGHSLAHKLKRGPLLATEALLLGEQIAGALQEAHEQGVIHRDLKPANIIVTPKGHAKVLDFGLAKFLEPVGAKDMTLSLEETKGPVGTPLYMSPEQAEGKLVDSRTDLWSLGVVFYESLAGTVPFEGKSGLEVFRAITEQPPKPLLERCPGAPEEANRIVLRALEKDVTKRYQTASEMSRDLSSVLARLSTSTRPPEKPELRLSLAYALPAAILVLLLAVAGTWLYHRSEQRRWARLEAIPGIEKLQGEGKSVQAFGLLQEAERYLPNDPNLSQAAEQDTTLVSVTSSPPGAVVAIQDYLHPDGPWLNLGATPLKNVRIPTGYFRWKISKQGLADYLAAPETNHQMNFSLDSAQAAPPGMVWVKGGVWENMIDFVGWVGPYDLPAFYMDRFEVTNRQYQEFVDQGAYRQRQYWKEKFHRDGKELSWEEAMALFHDPTGRAGPATWEAGHFPEGQADYPVSGVSWYEASAYAAYAGKSLPTLAQWYKAAPPDVATYAVQKSNISLSALAPVGTFQGLGPYGTYDMAGNVREWAENPRSDDQFLLFGGAWNSQTYLSVDPEALPPFDRSSTNGFRCVRNLAPLPEAVTGRIKTIDRDFSKAKPASDEVFRAYQAEYSYQHTPLHAKSEGVVEETADWRKEKITFDTAYGNERMAAYLFLPKRVLPPFQTVVFFPSARVLDIPNSQTLGDLKFFDYVIQSGRAVLYPVYQDTYERRSRNGLPGATQYRDVVIQRFKDLARSVDYLKTRPDVDKDKLAYLGVSMGSAEGVIYTTLLQNEFSTAVFLDGGYFLGRPAAGLDQADFAPRLKMPVLMVNGRYDFTFSLETAQNPLFQMLGTPPADKKHVVLESPHDVTDRRTELVPEVLNWLNKYLGAVKER